MKKIDGSQIRNALAKQLRIYLCGDLSEKEELDYIKTDGLEIGVSQYKEYTLEKAHFHRWNNEYNFVLDGGVKVYVFDEQKEYEFKKDDMYMVEPNMRYITKALPGTKIIFVKSPGGNDKEVIPASDQIMEWGKNWESKI